jgi:hypothetical protein
MAAVFDIASLATAVLLMSLAAATCLSANNLGRRLLALFIAMVGAMLAASVLHADGGALIAGIAATAAYAAMGFSLLVRLQEAYQSIETDEVDANDLSDEPSEPQA